MITAMLPMMIPLTILPVVLMMKTAIASVPILNTFLDTSYSLSIDVNNSHPSDPARLHVWLDSDNSGTFDVDEYQTANIAAATGASTQSITWSGLSGVNQGLTLCVCV